jgi:hypothetical protein
MAAVAVLPSGKQLEAAMDVDQPSSTTQPAAEDDLYTRLKTLQRQLEFLEIQVGWRGRAAAAGTAAASMQPDSSALLCAQLLLRLNYAHHDCF